MTMKGLLVVILSLCAMTAFGYWRLQEGVKTQSVAQFAFIQDASDSVTTDCDRIIGLAERALTMPETGSGSTISLLALGDEATADEPRLLGEFQIPIVRRVIEGQRAAAREKEALLKNVKNRCSEVEQTHESPVFQALKRGVEHLQSIGSAGDSRYLFIQTDGEETENIQIKKALNTPPGSRFSTPYPIQNNGVHVIFCGMAETIGTVKDASNTPRRKSKQRGSERAERLREVWSKIFTMPELVRFEPYCSRGER